MGRGSLSWLFYAVAAALLWSTIGVAYRYAILHGASPSWLILGRPLLGGLASLAAWLYGVGRPTRWSLLVGVAGLAPLIVSYLKAVEMVGAGLAAILLYTAPIWVTVLSPLVLAEKPTKLSTLASLGGFLGVVLVAYPAASSPSSLLGVLVGLASGASYAAYMLLARLAQLRGATSLETGLHSQLFAALAVAVMVHPSTPPSNRDIPWILYLGIATMLVPYILHVQALRRARAYQVAVVSLAEPVSANILAHLVLGEAMKPVQLLGAAAILASAATTTLAERGEE